jgi:hypothetical protein
VEFVCIDTTREHDRYFAAPQSEAFLGEAFPADGGRERWRIPYSHHPVYCAGPEHGNTDGMDEILVPLFRRSGVKLVLAGHEHNFQHAESGGIHYIVAGAGGKLRRERPTRFDAAHVRDFAVRGHFLVVELERDRACVRPFAVSGDGEVEPLERETPRGEIGAEPIAIELGARLP